MLKENFQKSTPSTIHAFHKYLADQGFTDICIDHDAYEPPSKIIKSNQQDYFVPNATALKDDHKVYFEWVPRHVVDKPRLLNKWQLLSTLARMKDGIFYLIVPDGKLRYTRQLLKDHDIIEADILHVKALQTAMA
jgi:hypothetical protein